MQTCNQWSNSATESGTPMGVFMTVIPLAFGVSASMVSDDAAAHESLQLRANTINGWRTLVRERRPWPS